MQHLVTQAAQRLHAAQTASVIVVRSLSFCTAARVWWQDPCNYPAYAVSGAEELYTARQGLYRRQRSQTQIYVAASNNRYRKNAAHTAVSYVPVSSRDIRSSQDEDSKAQVRLAFAHA